MENIYTNIEAIPTSATGTGAKLRFSSVVCLMQDAASIHADRLGVGFEYLHSIKRAFVLSRLQLKVCAPMPCWNDRIVLQTWPRGVDRLFALRDFEFSREGREPFLKATTAWLVIDTEQRHPVRPQEYLVNITAREVRMLGEEAPRKLQWADNTTLFDVRHARASDLDLNGHVNNTRYVDWITDAIAERHGVEAEISELAINFLAEVRMREEVRIGIAEEPDGEIVVQGETAKRSFTSRVRFNI